MRRYESHESLSDRRACRLDDCPGPSQSSATEYRSAGDCVPCASDGLPSGGHDLSADGHRLSDRPDTVLSARHNLSDRADEVPGNTHCHQLPGAGHGLSTFADPMPAAGDPVSCQSHFVS